jgi:biotin carboxyl carrier protein
MSQYKLSVNDEFLYNFSSDDLSQFDAISTSESNFHILDGKQSYSVHIDSSDFLAKQYTVKVGNNTYAVHIQNPLDLLIKEMGFEVGAGKQVNAITAPMPGLILDINVETGQTVAKNDLLLILGAMKMENSFLSPRDGTIKAILVHKGDAVEKGQLLIEFE